MPGAAGWIGRAAFNDDKATSPAVPDAVPPSLPSMITKSQGGRMEETFHFAVSYRGMLELTDGPRAYSLPLPHLTSRPVARPFSSARMRLVRRQQLDLFSWLIQSLARLDCSTIQVVVHAPAGRLLRCHLSGLGPQRRVLVSCRAVPSPLEPPQLLPFLARLPALGRHLRLSSPSPGKM
jgi:hypothetical protein